MSFNETDVANDPFSLHCYPENAHKDRQAFIGIRTKNDLDLGYSQAVRLRDWLTEVIDAAGPRPLHPHVAVISGMDHYVPGSLREADYQRLSDALYELDERRARDGEVAR